MDDHSYINVQEPSNGLALTNALMTVPEMPD